MPESGDIASLIREFGVPTMMLVLLSIAWTRRILVLGSELDRKQADLQREIEYREARRIEERAARIAAEERLDLAVQANRELTAAFREAEHERMRDVAERVGRRRSGA